MSALTTDRRVRASTSKIASALSPVSSDASWMLPGWISIPLIELLQHWAQRLLVVGVIVLYLVCGAAAGLGATDARRRDATVVLTGALPWLLTLLSPDILGTAPGDSFRPPEPRSPDLLDDYGEIASSYSGLATLALAIAAIPVAWRRRPGAFAIGAMAVALIAITEVAQLIGCASHSHFSVLFHRSTGCSPRDYRSGD